MKFKTGCGGPKWGETKRVETIIVRELGKMGLTTCTDSSNWSSRYIMVDIDEEQIQIRISDHESRYGGYNYGLLVVQSGPSNTAAAYRLLSEIAQDYKLQPTSRMQRRHLPKIS